MVGSKLARNWWVLVVRGACAIVFGMVALLYPIDAIAVLVALYGAFALVDGLLGLVAAVMGAETGARWWALLLEGVSGVIIGVITFLWPEITELFLLYLIALWAVITGIFEIVAATHLRKHLADELWLILSGALSIFFGVFLVVAPLRGLVIIAVLVAFYAILFGALLIGLAFRLRKWHQNAPA